MSSSYPSAPGEILVTAHSNRPHIPVWDEYQPDSSITIVHEQSKRKLGDRVSERILMPPPTQLPTRAAKKTSQSRTSLPVPSPKKATVMAPVLFVSNSVQVLGRLEDSPRSSSVRYDTMKYRYKAPNYVVTDVPDLWSNSKMEVVEENRARSPPAIVPVEPPATVAHMDVTESVPAKISPATLIPPDSKSVGDMHGRDSLISVDVADIHALPARVGKLSSMFGGLDKIIPPPKGGDRFVAKSSTRDLSPVSDEEVGGASPEMPARAVAVELSEKSSVLQKQDEVRLFRAQSLESTVSSSTDGVAALDWLVTSVDASDERNSRRHKKKRPRHASEKVEEKKSSSEKKKKKGKDNDSKIKRKRSSASDVASQASVSAAKKNRTETLDDAKNRRSSHTRDTDASAVKSKSSSPGQSSDSKKRKPDHEKVSKEENESKRIAKFSKVAKAVVVEDGEILEKQPTAPLRDRTYSTGRRSSTSERLPFDRRSSDRDIRSSDRDRKTSSRPRSPDRDRRSLSRSSHNSQRSTGFRTSYRTELSSRNQENIRHTYLRDRENSDHRSRRSTSKARCDPPKDVVVTDILDLIEQHLSKEDGQVSEDSDNDDVASISAMSLFGKPSIMDKRSKKIEINLHCRHKKSTEKSRGKERRSSTGGGEKRKGGSGSPVSRAVVTRSRRRSLSPVRRRGSLDRTTTRRRSISPGASVISRRRALSPPVRNRRHRASSYDTIRSSQLDYPMLRKIAAENAIEFRRKGIIPPQYAMTPEERAIWQSGGKTLDDLTALCKRMAQGERKRGGDDDDDRSSVASDLPIINHPYHVKDRVLVQGIGLNIRDSRNLPLRSGQERAIQNLPLRQLYPVSTGSTHRDMTWQTVEPEREMRPRELQSKEKHDKEGKSDGKSKSKKKDPTEGPEDQPMTLERQLANQLPPPDYRIPISFSDKLRLLKFQRELATNPDNPEMLGQMQETHQQMMEWANQFQYRGPAGQFAADPTQPKEVVPLYQPWDRQAWVRKDQLLHLTPVGGKGQYLLQKMGWVIGQAIGLRNKGVLEPLKMEIKLNKRGLQAESERGGNSVIRPGVKTVKFGGCPAMHPCSALNEACTKRGWGTPAFDLVKEEGHSHMKTFLFKVKINGVDYRPTVTGSSKKLAKAEVAKWCLDALGLIKP